MFLDKTIGWKRFILYKGVIAQLYRQKKSEPRPNPGRRWVFVLSNIFFFNTFFLTYFFSHIQTILRGVQVIKN